MKKVFFIFTLMVFSALFFIGCQNDSFDNLSNSGNTNRSTSSQSLTSNVTLSPNVTTNDLYNQILAQETQHHFLDTITKTFGDIFWLHTMKYIDTVNNLEVVYIPLGFYGLKKTQAILHAVRPLNPIDAANSYKINLISWNEIQNYSEHSNYISEYTIPMFDVFDFLIYKIDVNNNSLAERVKQINERNAGGGRACYKTKIKLCYQINCANGGDGNWNAETLLFTGGFGTYGTWVTPATGGDGGGGDGCSGIDFSAIGDAITEAADDTGDFFTKIWNKIFGPKVRCYKFLKGEINSEKRDGECYHCADYYIQFCDDGDWWNQHWNIQPCVNCDTDIDEDLFDQLELKCKSNKNAELKAKYNLPNSIESLNQLADLSECNCIGNNHYDECVLDELLLAKLETFLLQYPINPAGSSSPYNAQELLDLDIIPYSLLSSGNFDGGVLSILLGEFNSFYESLGISNNNDKYSILQNNFSNEIPKCQGCSNGEKEKMYYAHSTTLSKLDCVLQRLKNFDINSPDLTLIYYLREDFHISVSLTNSELDKFINRFETLIKWVRFRAPSTDYQVDNNCGPNTIAWTFPLQFTDIRLCNPNFFNETQSEQWKTISHEMMHLYLAVGDVAYNWQAEFGTLSTPEALFNADSYSEFFNHICQ